MSSQTREIPLSNPVAAVASNPGLGYRHASRPTILLADDEAAIRDLAGTILRGQGYEVLEARDGVDALEAVDRHHRPIHLIVTDWWMPRMGGAGLIAGLADTHPEAEILIVPGFLDTEPPLQAAILPKPFSVVDLVRTVRDLLECSRRRRRGEYSSGNQFRTMGRSHNDQLRKAAGAGG